MYLIERIIISIENSIRLLRQKMRSIACAFLGADSVEFYREIYYTPNTTHLFILYQ